MYFDHVLLQLVDMNTPLKYWVGYRQLTWFTTETFELLLKKLCKVWFVIREYSMRNCMLIQKLNFEV